MATISGKRLGSKKPLFSDFSVPLTCSPGKTRPLSDVISEIVIDQVSQFEERQRGNQFVRVLTEKQIREGAERGKVASGPSEVPVQPVDQAAAIATAIEAFKDGLYLVVIDGQNIESLNSECHIVDNSRITFIRLTLLAGG